MRPVFCGDLDFDCRDSDVERLFRRYGRVDRVDMKSGFAFVYMEDEHDAEVAIQKLDGIHFGRKGCKIRVEWTKRERGGRRDDISKRSSTNSRPSKTLFVINFDPINTRNRDIERYFEHYGRILSVRIRRNFAFVQYELQEDATRALEASHRSNFMDRVISVEYANRDDDGYNPDGRVRDVSPGRRNYDRGHSPIPYRRDRGSPDYGRETLPSSRFEQRDRDRHSPDYGREALSNSTSQQRGKGSPDYGREVIPNSRTQQRERGSPDFGRETVPNSRSEQSNNLHYGTAESPLNTRYNIHSPPRERSRSRS
ncbi:serine/arginine-rich splicing factor RS40 [Sesamum indicum]|uniref:Serine/arginine-rich splicing factor RS40 n=1 Tax=Sesamum indicum TaxID=4182 RepID=A0A6I9TZY1_SESIN|nr:serine/arginine-rich splicing factor RS40 [Sesamum indicum]XP_011093179.1 serine/arginine-rich splicing factor RS40 [Sesamum indicum]